MILSSIIKRPVYIRTFRIIPVSMFRDLKLLFIATMGTFPPSFKKHLATIWTRILWSILGWWLRYFSRIGCFNLRRRMPQIVDLIHCPSRLHQFKITIWCWVWSRCTFNNNSAINTIIPTLFYLKTTWVTEGHNYTCWPMHKYFENNDWLRIFIFNKSYLR